MKLVRELTKAEIETILDRMNMPVGDCVDHYEFYKACLEASLIKQAEPYQK